MRTRVLVNAGSRRQWRLVLDLSWDPAYPDSASVVLFARPAHPVLPTGSWQVPLTDLSAALERPVDVPGVRFSPHGARLWLEVEHAYGARVVAVPARVVEDFLAGVREAARTAP